MTARKAPGRTVAAGLLLQPAFGLVFAWGAVVPHLRAELGWPPLLLAAVLSATPLGYGPGTLVGGRLAERLPPRRICTAAVTLLAAGLTVALALPSGLTFVVFYGWLALGVGGGMALTGSVAATVRLFPTRAGTAAGAMTAAYAAASIVQAPALAALSQQIGWLAALRWTGGSMLGLAVLALALMPAGPAAGGLDRGADPPTGQLGLLRRTRMWTSCAMVPLGALLGAFAAVDLVADAQAHRLAGWAAATTLAVFGIGNALGRVLSGILADRVGVTRVAVAVLGCPLVAAPLLAWGEGEAVFLTASVVAGIALGGTAGLIGRLAADGAPDAPHSAFGLLFAAYAAGAVCGPLLGAAAGGGAASWLVVGLPAAGGLLALGIRSRAH